jgi:hypothetical protein
LQKLMTSSEMCRFLNLGSFRYRVFRVSLVRLRTRRQVLRDPIACMCGALGLPMHHICSKGKWTVAFGMNKCSFYFCPNSPRNVNFC